MQCPFIKSALRQYHVPTVQSAQMVLAANLIWGDMQSYMTFNHFENEIYASVSTPHIRWIFSYSRTLCCPDRQPELMTAISVTDLHQTTSHINMDFWDWQLWTRIATVLTPFSFHGDVTADRCNQCSAFFLETCLDEEIIDIKHKRCTINYTYI